jgi:hypothetical protein
MKLLLRVSAIVVASLLIDCALLYIQARDGKKLPYKFRLIPTMEVGS